MQANRSDEQIDEGNLWDRCTLLQVSDREDDRVWCVTRIASPGARHLSINLNETRLSAGSKIHFLVDGGGSESDAFLVFTLEPPPPHETETQDAKLRSSLKGQLSTPPLQGLSATSTIHTH